MISILLVVFVLKITSSSSSIYAEYEQLTSSTCKDKGLLLIRTKEECESGDYPEIETTSAELEWDPQTDQFERCENAMLDAHGNLKEGLPTKPKFVIKELQTESLQGNLVDITDDAHLGSVLESNVNVSLTSVCNRNLRRLARVKRTIKEVELTPRDGEFPLNSGGTIKS